MGNLAARLLSNWKTTATWANDFKTEYNKTQNIATARAAADIGKPVPGTPQFDDVFKALSTTNNTDTTLFRVAGVGGAALRGVVLLDNSTMTHTEGMYNFKDFLPEAIEVVTGASYRKYNMLTKGTAFPTKKDGSEFTLYEVGLYAQGSYNLKIADDINLKPTVALRYDKNQFFKGGVTPRISGVLSLFEHNIRASWQSAFRNPSPNQLLSDGKTGEVGGSEIAFTSADLIANPGYTNASVTAYRASKNTADLVKFAVNPADFTTEKIKTWEIGYKTLIGNKLFIDAFYFGSKYSDFIAAPGISQPKNGPSAITDLLSPATTIGYTNVNFNNFNEIYVNGWGLGVDYALGGGYNIAANYANQVGTVTLRNFYDKNLIVKDEFGIDIIKRKMSDPSVAKVQRNFFISPENRYNISVSNPKVTKNFGFNVSYRWTDKMWVEQGGTQGDIWLPSWQTIDAAVMYKLPQYKTTIKLGANNLFNKYYSQGYGLAQIGGLYYVSLNFDEFLNR